MSRDDEQGDELYGQALFVVAGAHAGRICESDDTTFVCKEDLTASERKLVVQSGTPWLVLEEDADQKAEDSDEPIVGVNVEVVTFGYYLQSRQRYYIPRRALRPATMKDLVQRHFDLSESIGRSQILKEKVRGFRLTDLLIEKIYIMDQIWEREKLALISKIGKRKDVFLCHSSEDKPFVRQVYMDLLNLGLNVWMDEYEITVGESIVERIGDGTSKASGLILFISSSSSNSKWVEREWSSTLMRKLAGNDVKILPCLIEEAPIPALLSDIKYADFRDSYESGLEQLMRGLAN